MAAATAIFVAVLVVFAPTFLTAGRIPVKNLTPQITPSSTTTYLGGRVTFNCSINILSRSSNPFQLAWQADGLLGPPIFTNNASITLDVVVNKVSYNNTNVYCLGRYQGQPGKVYSSSEGTILIQGPLSAVNVSQTELNECTAQVFWNPPFTLPGVPIRGYDIVIGNLDTNIENNFTTNGTSINIPSGYDYSVSVTAINDAGEGNETIIYIDSNEPRNETIQVDQIHVSRDGQAWTIDATVISEYLCGNVSYSICEENSNASCLKNSKITETKLSDNKTRLLATMNLDENRHYNVTVMNGIGKYSLYSPKNEISTFDIQTVRIFQTKDYLCLAINYVEGRIATGGFMLLKCAPDLSINYTIEGHEIVSGCSPELSFYGVKNCTLKVYDKVNEIVENNSNPAVIRDVILTGAATQPSATTNINTISTTITPTMSTTPKTTMSTMTTITMGTMPTVITTTSSMSTDTSSTVVPTSTNQNEHFKLALYISVPIVIVLIVIIIILLVAVAVLITMLCMKKQKGEANIT